MPPPRLAPRPAAPGSSTGAVIRLVRRCAVPSEAQAGAVAVCGAGRFTDRAGSATKTSCTTASPNAPSSRLWSSAALGAVVLRDARENREAGRKVGVAVEFFTAHHAVPPCGVADLMYDSEVHYDLLPVEGR